MRIELIKADISDSNFLLKLRNSQELRKYSKNKKLISKQNHLKWLNSKLDDKKNKIFVIKLINKKLGYIRLQKQINWEVSIGILKAYRNKKIGKQALSSLEKKFKKIKIFAKVHKSNTNSLNFFLSCNYCISEKNRNFYIMKKINHLKIIESIGKIRSKNNSSWMQILKIAFKYSPREASKAMKNIYYYDKKISQLVKKLK